MSYVPIAANQEITFDAGARARTSQLTTLFDGKTLNADDTNIWSSAGTGSQTFSNSIVSMAVTAGQYAMRQSRLYMPYYSGKSQTVEITFDTFANDANVVKRVGYFSSNAVAPYDSTYDGVWIEATGTSYKLCVANAGSLKLNLDWTLWDGYDQLSGYDWDSFTVALIDFLWLGGAVLRLFLKTPTGFVLAHTFSYAGSGVAGTFMKSPQQPVRYEIRSTTGSGSLSVICSQVASEGSASEVGQSRALYNPTAITCNAVGTTYALKGTRALAAFRDQGVFVSQFGGAITATTDVGLLLLLRNPTLSAPLTWETLGSIEAGTATTQTVTDLGWVVDVVPLVSNGVSRPLDRNLLADLTISVANVPDELVLAYRPLSINQTIIGTITTYRR
jgi:hypothetical protein